MTPVPEQPTNPEEIQAQRDAEQTKLVQERETIKADQDMQAIRALRKATWFETYWKRRMREDRAKFCEEIATSAPVEDIPRLRGIIKYIDMLLARPDVDRQSAHKLLHGGNKPLVDD